MGARPSRRAVVPSEPIDSIRFSCIAPASLQCSMPSIAEQRTTALPARGPCTSAARIGRRAGLDHFQENALPMRQRNIPKRGPAAVRFKAPGASTILKRRHEQSLESMDLDNAQITDRTPSLNYDVVSSSREELPGSQGHFLAQ
mmetsp:Transcript_91457/g.244897  ORF Transcript_91457/g.244897 Transcript_91457/m.244897 type:complete len:144 (+) Transcript_91457:38-469(+)